MQALVLALLAVVLAATSVRADVPADELQPVAPTVTTIALSASAALKPEPAVYRLGDIASISPPQANLADLVVSGPVKNGEIIRLEAVRDVLESAGINLGRIVLRSPAGGGCVIKTSEAQETANPLGAGAKSSRQLSTLPQSVDVSNPTTIRSRIALRLMDLFNADAEVIRLGFEPGDEDFLNQSVGGRVVHIQPGGTSGARLPVTVTIYRGDKGSERIEATRIVTTTVQLAREVVSARTSIARQQAITEDVLDISTQWVSPGARETATREQIVTALAKNRIPAGSIITPADLTTPTIVKRGDVVYVHVVSGAVTVKARARAMAAARDGELVQLKLEGSDKPFQARMSGRGVAVMVQN